MSAFSAPIATEIWDMKYRFKYPNGILIDQTVEDTWRRVARTLASVESKCEYWEREFYQALEDFKFLPAGRIIAGAGTNRNVTLFNCYVMGTIPDSMDGIFEGLKEAAVTLQQGGGIGYDFSTIRPKSAEVKGVAADASGPLSFMDVWDAMCRTIMSAGSRRGAMMATMRCDHPDIEDFIAAKQDALRLRMFNLSVLVTDSFMEAVKTDGLWGLRWDGKVCKTVQARDLWNRIMQSTYDFAEPGVIFIDRINTDNNLNDRETIAATNPCGEQPLPPYGACLLGSINLSRFVTHPFTEKSSLNINELKWVVGVAVRMMDNVVDVSNFPLPEQKAEAQAKRRIGLGVTGLADMLAMLKMKYGSKDAADYCKNLMKIIDIQAYETSCDLAKEKGSFPEFYSQSFLADGTHASRLPDSLKNKIKWYGIRNSHLTSIAPTGTISLYAGNVSSGIEPIFAMTYNRKVLQNDGTYIDQSVEDYAVAQYRSLPDIGSDSDLPDYFVSAQTLDPIDHLRMQAAIQPWVDSSISKTVNLPKNISFDDFCDVYTQSYEMGCKGCTTYRPNNVTGSVISVADETQAVPDAMNRPQALDGHTYKMKWPQSEHAIYVTINDIVQNGQRRPFEVFINSRNMEHYAWTLALTRMISAVFRRGGDITFVAEELKAVFDPRGGAWVQGTYIPSILAAIGRVIEKHMIRIGFIEGAGPHLKEDPASEMIPLEQKERGKSCPSCGGMRLQMAEGCMTCLDCGSSECG